MGKKILNIFGVILLLVSIPVGLFGYKLYRAAHTPFPIPDKEYSLGGGEFKSNFTESDLKLIADNSLNHGNFKNGVPPKFTSHRLIVPAIGLNMVYNGQSFVKHSGYSSLNLNLDPNIAAKWSSGTKTILAAHSNDNWGNLGEMTKINGAPPNSLIIVTDGGGVGSYYRSQLLKSYLKRKLPEVMFTGSEEILALVTCGGSVSFSREQHMVAHQKNVVLLARPINY